MDFAEEKSDCGFDGDKLLVHLNYHPLVGMKRSVWVTCFKLLTDFKLCVTHNKTPIKIAPAMTGRNPVLIIFVSIKYDFLYEAEMSEPEYHELAKVIVRTPDVGSRYGYVIGSNWDELKGRWIYKVTFYEEPKSLDNWVPAEWMELVR